MPKRNVQALIALVGVLSLLLSCAPAEQKAAPAPAGAAKTAPTAANAAAPPAVTPKPAATAAPAATTASTPAAAAADKPVYGGTLAYSLRDDPPTFDLHQSGTQTVFSAVGGAYNSLLMWDHVDHNKMVPDIAKKWEVSSDAKTFTFYLEEGAKWHDGTPFTAEDVKFSLLRERFPPKDIYIFARGMLEPIESVEAVDRYTVKVKTSRATASFPMMMTLSSNSILPKHVLEQKVDMKFEEMGTGPWKLKKYTRGVSVELVKNPDYFKKGLPYLDAIVQYIVPDPSARLAAFRVGRLMTDYSDHEPPAIDQIEKTMSDVAIAYRIPGVVASRNPFIVQNKPPFNDVRVRQATSLAMDRWEFVRMIDPGFYGVGGYMTPGGLWALPDDVLYAQPGYAKTGPAKDAEREKAKKLLADAGYPNGFEFEMEARARPEYVNSGVWMKAQLEKIGIKTNIKPVETTTYYDHLEKQGFQMMSSGNSFDGDDPDLIFSMAFLKDAGKNYGKYVNAEFDKLFEEQATAVDVAKRKEIVQKMQLILHETVPYPVLGWRTRTVGVWKKVKGYTPWTSNGRLSSVYRHEYTWLDPNLPPK